MHTHNYTHWHAYTKKLTHTNMHTNIFIQTHTHAHTHTHTCTHTRTHALYTHAYTNAHTHAKTPHDSGFAKYLRRPSAVLRPWQVVPFHYKKALFHISVAPSIFRCSVDTFSKKHCFVGRLKQLQFSVGTSEAKCFSLGNIQTKTLFCGSHCFL